MKKQIFLLLAGLAFLAQAANSQCAFDPIVTGDTLLCPDTPGLLKTQEYDSYQWYKKAYGSDTPILIPGATGQSLIVTQDDVLFSFWVEATLNGCTEPSPEVLLDGYVFLLPFVAHTGDYTFDPETETFKICEGDTMFLTLGQPYDTEITWFQNGLPIPGENSAELAVTQTGAYTVQGAPSVCPAFIQPLGLILPVLVEQCATAVRPSPEAFSLQVYPNPTAGPVTLETAGDRLIETVVLTDANGRLVREWKQLGAVRLAVSLQDVPVGTYFMKIISGDLATVRRIVKR